MQFVRLGNSFRVARITGPSHNLLGIELGEGRTLAEDPSIGVLSLAADGEPGVLLSASEVRDAVLMGVAEANEELGTIYSVKQIEFVPSDSPPAETYRFLARAIIERLNKGQAFEDSE
jgi:hypothetical protein